MTRRPGLPAAQGKRARNVTGVAPLFHTLKGSGEGMLAQQRHRVNRKQVIMCVLDGRPWAEISGLGHRVLMGEFSLEYALSTPSSGTLEKILSEIFFEVKNAVVETLRSLHLEYGSVGYVGGFCGLQLDLTTMANQEYCTASVAAILPGDTNVAHLGLATKVFPGTHEEEDVRRWIEEVR